MLHRLHPDAVRAAALKHLAENDGVDVIKLKAHFDDPDDPTSLPPRRRFLMFMNEMDRALSYCSGDEGLPDFWKPLYPGYAALVRVRAYVNTFTE